MNIIRNWYFQVFVFFVAMAAAFFTLNACLPVVSFAQEAAAPAEGLPFLEKLINGIPLSGSVITVAIFALEFILRVVKTEKPKSLLLLLGAVFKQLARLFQKLSEFMDLLGLQRLNPPRYK